MFAKRLLRNRLPTRNNFVRRNIIQHIDSLCSDGCNVLESARHLFLDCGTSNSLWTRVRNWLGISTVFPSDLCEYLHQFLKVSDLHVFGMTASLIMWIHILMLFLRK